MDLLQGNIRQIYLRFLAASFGSALITSIYGLVDMAMVGQYHGPDGAAAMAVIAPVWNIVYSLGLLAGIGGSVLYSFQKGGSSSRGSANAYFTAAVVGGGILSLLLWVGIWLWEEPLLRFFGADQTLLPLAKAYLLPVKFSIPVFLFTQIISAFLRNDSHPSLATRAVLIGGIFNVAGDWFFVFALDMGILGAGLATAMGAVLSLGVMLTHFRSPQNTLSFAPFSPRLWGKILRTGFSTFFIDIAMGILSLLFNRQIMTWLGTDALAVYGVIINISTFVQCCAYGVGQAAQPILSQNFGARLFSRIRSLVRYNLITVFLISLVWLVLVMAFPNGFIRLFMAPTPAVLAIAPFIIRCYGLSFLFLPLNVYATYYFQAILRPGTSFAVSFARGMAVSGLLILLLPLIGGGQALWLAMPLTETLTAAFVLPAMNRTLRAMAPSPALSR